MQDGAEWLQGLVDYHRADAVRILDFAHAAEYINDIGQAVQAAGGRLPAHWLEEVLHRLKHQGPARVLTHLAWLATRYPSPLMQEKLTYLQKREAHMQYPTYQEAGWPIGSGSVESANKLVVEARLKGAGMRWVGRTSTRCWCCAMRYAIESGSRPGRRRWRIDKRCAPSVGKQRASNGWTGPLVPRHWGTRVYRLSHPLLLLPLLPRLRSSRSNQLLVLALATWHKPFLRRPPSILVATEEVGPACGWPFFPPVA